MAAEAVIREWGNSLGIVLPKELVENRGLKKGDEIHIEIIRKADFSDIFGSMNLSLSGQEAKDMAREGWD